MIFLYLLCFLSFTATLHVPSQYSDINIAFANVSEIVNIIFNNAEAHENNLGITE